MARTRTIFSVLCAFVVLIALAIFIYKDTAKKQRQGASLERNRLLDIEFDSGLGKPSSSFDLVEKSMADQTRYRLLKKTWQKQRPLLARTASITRIPKIIHQIWVGPRKPPSFLQKFSMQWQAAHPDWEYRLWTDADVKEFDFELRDLYDQSSNYGEKADILRCEVLLKYGGLYVDADFECLGPFDELIERYDFFAGTEYPHVIPETDRVLLVSNAIVGIVPNHPILYRWKELIRKKWQKTEDTCFNPIEKVLTRTFFTFGDAVEYHLEHEEYCNIVFPSTYFFPIKPAYLRNPPETPSLIKRISYALGFKKEHTFFTVKPETLAVHHFAGRWQKNKNQLFKEMHKEIIKLRKSQAKLMKEVSELKVKVIEAEHAM